MDRLTRKDLKTDKFAQEVGQGVEFLSHHSSDVKKYGIAALAVIILGAGYYFYSNYQASARQVALAQALKVDDSTVSPAPPQPPLLAFATQEEKTKARIGAYSDVAIKYHGTQEAAVAQLYLAAALVDQGKFPEAEKAYKEVVDSAPKEFASIAKVALGALYSAQGKHADAEKILREVVANPTVFVSKDEATIHLAEALAESKPEEARKLLEPLRTARTIVSRSAVSAMNKLPQK